jgi:leucyl-tRNA synthetase
LQTEKRDTLIAIEKKYQKKWQEDRVFQPVRRASRLDFALHADES